MLGRKESLSSQLTKQLAQKIDAKVYAPGTRIPTEAELCQEYGVSRTVVREAIASLRADGLVIPRQGIGVFVSERTRLLPFEFDAKSEGALTDILYILELRLSVELEAAALAAERRTARQLQVIRARFKDVAKEIRDAQDRGRSDFEFHMAIARATNNPYFEKFLSFIGPQIIPRIRMSSLQTGRLSDQEYHATIQKEHAAIVEAITARDANAARDAMRAHLSGSLERYRAQNPRT
ncbi:FadR/GntR family transcriptional regulator [Microvirga makkahensis]|uniref:FCD domain-containing protein n=1 Tax=Microvirga makkahensis TaxID=1128670 RepID=A0A7X3SPE4_9HYPH|nr:FadR/GntR family transcriptional regulator [Microvirga makkahensis]MXQ12185.1 FCD domain-containing protein [Microvirga makkahensis]